MSVIILQLQYIQSDTTVSVPDEYGVSKFRQLPWQAEVQSGLLVQAELVIHLGWSETCIETGSFNTGLS